MRILVLILLFHVSSVTADDSSTPIRFGLTAVVVTENLRFLDQWSQYLEEKTGYKVEFVLRKSYREVMDLLVSQDLDFAWICGYPYIQPRQPESLQLLTVPVYRGKPLYHSYIIVPYNSPADHFDDLNGKVFAYSDPDSNSGFLYPQTLMIEQGLNPLSFFRQTFFTFNHAETVQAVSEQVADGGAVDSYIWEYLAIFQPELTKKTKIINKSPKFGFPPIVSRTGVNTRVVQLMKETLENMNREPTGKGLLDHLKLDGFGHFPDSLFNDIRAMADKVIQTDAHHSIPTD